MPVDAVEELPCASSWVALWFWAECCTPLHLRILTRPVVSTSTRQLCAQGPENNARPGFATPKWSHQVSARGQPHSAAIRMNHTTHAACYCSAHLRAAKGSSGWGLTLLSSNKAICHPCDWQESLQIPLSCQGLSCCVQFLFSRNRCRRKRGKYPLSDNLPSSSLFYYDFPLGITSKKMGEIIF